MSHAENIYGYLMQRVTLLVNLIHNELGFFCVMFKNLMNLVVITVKQ